MEKNYIDKKTLQRGNQTAKNYMGKDYIEEGLHYTKELHKKKTIQGRKYTERDYIRRDYIRRDYIEKKLYYTREKIHEEEIIQ